MSGNAKNRKTSLEQRLADLDFSDQSRIRESLGRELAQEQFRRLHQPHGSEQDYRRWNMFRKPVPAFALGVVVALSILAFAHPDTRAALSKIQQIFHLGDNTVVYHAGDFSEAAVDSIVAGFDQQLEKGETYFLHNDYGGFGGLVPQGADPFIKQVASLSLAAGMVDFPLQVPTYFHENIPPRFRFRKAEVMPNGSIILTLGIGPYETMLMQTPVGEGKSMGHGTSTTITGSDGTRITTGVAPNLEEIEIDGAKVTWMIHDEGTRRNLGKWAAKKTDTVIGKFIWENDGVSYVLNGKLLTKDEGIKIIESLQSARRK